MNTPAPWIMALIYWAHLLATVIWIGALAATNLLLLPAAKKTLDEPSRLRLISAVQKQLEPLAWFCMGILAATGMFQMSANTHYNGFLDTSTQWSLSLLIKHLFGVLMVVVSAIQTWEVIPAIQRALLKKNGVSEEEAARLNRKEAWLLRVNFALSVLILGATAFARAA